MSPFEGATATAVVISEGWSSVSGAHPDPALARPATPSEAAKVPRAQDQLADSLLEAAKSSWVQLGEEIARRAEHCKRLPHGGVLGNAHRDIDARHRHAGPDVGVSHIL